MARKFKTDVELEAGVKLPNKTANRVPVIDGSNDLVESAVTDTELGYLSGTTSDIQTQLDSKIPNSEKAAANGVASLDGAGKVPLAQLPNAIMEYKGTWNASTNTPTLADGGGNPDTAIGDVYRVSVAGTQDLGSGNISFQVGDYVILNDSKVWERSPGADAVLSVNGQTGVVTLDTDDISEGSALYHTDERAQDAVGTILTDSASIDFTYDDGANTITAAAIPGGIDHDSLSGFVANEHIDWTTDAGTDIADANISETSVTQHEGAIDHDALTNFVANEHIDWTTDAGQDIADANISQSSVTQHEAAIDHDALTNFVGNEHVDHTSVDIATGADSGLTGGGDISTTRNLSVDIAGTTAETSADDADLILIRDDSAGALRSMTRANFLDGVAGGSAGDIEETSFAFADNIAAAADVTGLAFANATVRSFRTQLSIVRGSTYEVFFLDAIQRGSDWEMSVEATGDDTGVTFTITAAGQVQYTSTSTGSGGTMKFRAETTTV